MIHSTPSQSFDNHGLPIANRLTLTFPRFHPVPPYPGVSEIEGRSFSRFRKVAERKLTMLDNAANVNDLVAPAGNRLERLKGDGAGQHSIRINDRWRMDPTTWKSRIIIEGARTMIKNGMRPVHPGEILLEEFMKPVDPPINANTLARALEVPANRITAIIKGQRGAPAIQPYASRHFSTRPLSFG